MCGIISRMKLKNNDLTSKLDIFENFKRSMESLKYSNSLTVENLFQEKIPQLREMCSSIGTGTTIMMKWSIDELERVSKRYSYSPDGNSEHYGIYRPIAQRTNVWDDKYKCDYFRDYFINGTLTIKIGSPIDKPYKFGVFCYDSQHRMLFLTRALTGREKIKKSLLTDSINTFCEESPYGYTGNLGITELKRWIEETAEDELCYSHIMDNPNDYPYLSKIIEREVHVELTIATDYELKQQLFVHNNQKYPWTAFHTVRERALCMGGDEYIISYFQSNTNDSDWFGKNIVKLFRRNLLNEKKNKDFCTCIRLPEDNGNNDELISFYHTQLMLSIDGESKDGATIQFGNIYFNNFRNIALFSPGDKENHYNHHLKRKGIMDKGYKYNPERYSEDCSAFREIITNILQWIEKNSCGTSKNHLINKFNVNVKKTIKDTAKSRIGKPLSKFTKLTEDKLSSSVTNSVNKFSFKNKEFSVVAIAYLRSLMYECNRNNIFDVDIICSTFVTNLMDICVKFFEDYNNINSFESTKLSYENRVAAYYSPLIKKCVKNCKLKLFSMNLKSASINVESTKKQKITA